MIEAAAILLALDLGASSPVLAFETIGLGTVSASVLEPTGDDGGPARLVFRGPAREVVGDFTFDVGRGSPTRLSLRTIDADGMPTPLVIAVADMMGVDGVRIQAAVFAVQGRQVRPLLPAVLDLEAEDGMCVGSLGPDLPLGAAAIRSLSGDGCFLCWPKRFEALLYRWNGGRLAYSQRRVTRGRHKSWETAATELSLECADQMRPTVFGKEHK